MPALDPAFAVVGRQRRGIRRMPEVQIPSPDVLPDQPQRDGFADGLADRAVLADPWSVGVRFQVFVVVGTRDPLQTVDDFRRQQTGQAHPAFALQVLKVGARQVFGTVSNSEGDILQSPEQPVVGIGLAAQIGPGCHVPDTAGRPIPDHPVVAFVGQDERAIGIDSQHRPEGRDQKHMVMTRPLKPHDALLKLPGVLHSPTPRKHTDRHQPFCTYMLALSLPWNSRHSASVRRCGSPNCRARTYCRHMISRRCAWLTARASVGP